MPSTNFQQFDPTGTNMLNDTDYTANAQRQNGITAGQASSALHNKLFYQASTMVTALATYMVNQGQTATDTSLSGLVTAITNAFAPTSEITGVTKAYVSTTLPSGYVWANGTTIGGGSSGATGRANADTSALFSLLWASWGNTQLPIQDSSGGASTRGANAAADFAANKRLPTPDLRGRAPMGLDNLGGATAAGRVTSASLGGATSTTMGGSGGEETHALSSGEGPTHTHTVTDPGHHHALTNLQKSNSTATSSNYTTVSTSSPSALTGVNTDDATTGVSLGNSGSGTGHNNMEPWLAINYIVKL